MKLRIPAMLKLDLPDDLLIIFRVRVVSAGDSFSVQLLCDCEPQGKAPVWRYVFRSSEKWLCRHVESWFKRRLTKSEIDMRRIMDVINLDEELKYVLYKNSDAVT